MDPLETFKASQKAGWALFAPMAARTTAPAARLVTWAGIEAGQRVLDVACGTGVVAVTAARRGARVTGLDLTPELLVVAHENAKTAGVAAEFREGDVESLPFADASFDVVVSQFGHMFAPRAEVALAEMLRVLAPGGTIAFATWPPELFVGRMFTAVARYLPPPPPGLSPPVLWGDPHVVRERLGSAVGDLLFDRATLTIPALSTAHLREMTERTGPVGKLVETLAVSDPAKLAAFRAEYETLAVEYFAENVMRQDYLLTRATKL